MSDPAPPRVAGDLADDLAADGVRASRAHLPCCGAVDLVTFPTMLNGQQTETARHAYATAVMVADQALELAHSEVVARDALALVEPLHDALARFSALSSAGLLKVIS